MDELFSVGGKRALVTGGGTGLGRVCAEALLRAGAEVIIASRKMDALAVTAAELSALGPVEAVAADLSTEEGVAGLARAVADRWDGLDILVNNAGATWGASYDSFPWKGWARVMGVNVAGLFSLTRDLTPLLRSAARPDEPSRVVNLGSIAGTMPISDMAYSYSASKAAVHHLTRILARELAGDAITVNAIAPGPFPSNMTNFALTSEAGRAGAAKAVPLGRIGEPRHLAGTLLYLVGAAGAFTTGAIVPLDGGMTTHAVDIWTDSHAV